MKPYLATGGKPIFNEFITPVGLTVHCYHDKPQLETMGEFDKTPKLDKDGYQLAQFKVTLAWSKTRMGELDPMVQLAHRTKAEAWPEAAKPGAFFALQPFFRDGDNPEHNTKDKEYLRSRYYLNFKQKAVPIIDPKTKLLLGYSGAPGLLGPYGPEDVILPVDVYAGCTSRVSGIMFGTEFMGKHFISTRLNNIQKADDGDRLAGGARPTAASQFDAIKTGAPLGGGDLMSQIGALGSLLGGNTGGRLIF